ncbi:MAG: ABC transporter permease [Spirochaetaceae bacterium]|nr:MAG: ABC transporter permease [Spirochaetaceae bacterium]
MDKELLGIALRNITRNRRRTALNMIALTVGMTIMIAALGWVRGYFTTLYDGMITLDTGHVQVLHRDYLAEARRMPLDLLVENYTATRATLLESAGVDRASGRVEYELELGNGREYMPMRGRAIDPRYEREITTIENFIVSGRYLAASDAEPGVVIGRPAAELLGVAPGDTVFLRVRDRYGAPNTTTLKVVGLFNTGYPLFDRHLVITDLRQSTEFLRLGDAVTHIVLGLRGRSDPERVATALNAVLPDSLTAYRWQRFARTMIAVVEADIGAFVILMGILFFLVLLGILNSMSMAVRERGREIGTMRAIGLKRRQLRRLIIAESIAIALLSAMLACVFGGAFAAYVQFIGFDVAGMMPADLPIPFGERFFGDTRAIDFIATAALGVVTAVLGSLGPARRAARLAIVDTMRIGGV